MDSKVPKENKQKTQAIPTKPQTKEEMGDAHQAFVKRCIRDKPPKKEVVEELKKFIEVAEKNL